MIIKEINNVATAKTDYYSVNDIETIALVPRIMFAHTDRIDILENEEEGIREIIVNNRRYILKNVIEEDDYYIFQLDEVE